MQCSACTHWDRYEGELSTDVGDCRVGPPRISETILARFMAAPSYRGPDVHDLEMEHDLYSASAFPVTHESCRCGSFQPIPEGPGDLRAALDAANARTRLPLADDDGDAELFARNEALYKVIERVQALPNTRENLAARAHAVCAAVDYTGVAVEMTLSELATHAESNAGELVREILACLLDQVPA